MAPLALGPLPRRRSGGRFGGLALAVALLAAMAAGPLFADAPPGEWLTGRLLVADPGMQDPRFAETVVYMVEHSAEGALGLVVNRPVEAIGFDRLMRLQGLEPAGRGGDILLYYGGPVAPRSGFVLHSTDAVLEGTETIRGDVAITNQPEMLRALAEGRGPRRYLFLLGYAGWGPGQLETEIAEGAWFTVPAEASLIFGSDDHLKWKRARALQSIEL